VEAAISKEGIVNVIAGAKRPSSATTDDSAAAAGSGGLRVETMEVVKGGEFSGGEW
jgi:hypothetical protein